MSSPEVVQEYLQRHKVGVLFEDLMAKVISDMPDDPLIYLARVLQLRAEKKEGRSLRKTTDFDSLAVAKKNYDKPWATNSKRMKPKDSDLRTTKKGPRPDWDGKTKNVASSFDDIWSDSPPKRTGSPTKAVTISGLAAWADAGMEDGEDVMLSTYGYRGPHRSHREMSDPLAGELGLSKERPARTTPKPQYSAHAKKTGRNVNSTYRKESLQQYIKEREQRNDSGIEDDKHGDSDDAIELLEDIDELRREGAWNAKKSGVRMSSRRGMPLATVPVRVSICARCAKVMGGGLPSEPLQGTNLDDLTELDTERQASNRLRGGPFGVTHSDDDEEFESVSQVTGPRRPVWQESDNDAVSPRKGRHMLKSNMSPTKGLPMYSSSDLPKESARGKKVSTMPTRSDQFYEHHSPDADHNPMRMTWSPAMASGAEYSEKKPETTRTVTVSTSRTTKDEDIMTGRSQGTPWQVPPDYDTDSSYYGSPGGKPLRQDRAY